MDLLASIAALVGVGAITPGPNNFAVLNVAARSGVARAMPAIAGVVLGSLALFLLVATGAGALFDAQPGLRMVICVGGCAYLGYVGIRLVAGSFRGSADEVRGDAALPSDALGLFGFQFLNPKGWSLVLTATSAAQASANGIVDWAYLAAIFVGIPAACLLLWSLFGSLFTAHLRRPRFRARFDGAMGCTLLASAVLLLVEGLAA